MSHEELVKLVELEPSEEDEILKLWNQWNSEELRRYYLEVQDLHERFHRRRLGRARLIYETIGKRLRVRRVASIPKKYLEG